MSQIKRTERGWAGHYICSASCRYRRNTLLEFGNIRVVVSTVGAHYPHNRRDQLCHIGIGRSAEYRYYETMAFHATKIRDYYEAGDVLELSGYTTNAEISADSPDDLPYDVDNLADQMHEAVIASDRKSVV